MYGTLLLLGLAAVSADLAPAAAVGPRPVASPDSMADIYARMQRAVEEERFEEALTWAKALAAHPEFRTFPEEGARALDYLIGVLHLELGHPELAVAPLTRATEWSGATSDFWLMRLQAHAAARDLDGMAAAMILTLERSPETIDQLAPASVLYLAGSPELRGEAGLELRHALYDSGWRDEEDSGVWLRLVDDLVAHGRGDEARPVLERITDPYARAQLFALRRYDAVRPADAVFDPGVVLNASLAFQRKQAEAEGATVDQRNRLVSALLGLGRFDEALTAADAILAGPEPDPDADPEADSGLTWVMDNRARILLQLGRDDEALEQQRAAAARSEFGQPNISQTINLGWMALRLGRPAEAKAAVAAVDGDMVSPFGRMQLLQVQACAAHELSDMANANAMLGQLEAGWRDAPTALYGVYACRGDEDGMARVLIDMLADPDNEAFGVTLLHDYLGTGDVTAFDRRLAAQHHRVASRPEVVAARDRVGRALVMPTTGPQF